MDRANAALVDYLLANGHDVHVVTHSAASEYNTRTGLALHIVPRPLGSIAFGELSLASHGRRVSAAVRRRSPEARLVANGSNLGSDDLNWVHSVHHAWPCRDAGAPAWFRIKNRLVKAWGRSRERTAIPRARIVIANSDRTRRDLIERLGVDAARVHTVYLGSDPSWVPAAQDRRAAMRHKWCRDSSRPLVAFIGALGHDTNKGVDRVLAAWRLLLAAGWSGELIVAGPGNTRRWERLAQGLAGTVRFTGDTRHVGDILDAADLLVSPVCYEAYGLAVHEALCRNVPVAVTSTAGVVERMGPQAAELLLPEDADADLIASRVLRSTAAADDWKRSAAAAGAALRQYTERDMAAAFVDVAREVTP
jgi:glycosyltransferase involved in cell wall biosynthesis